MPPASYSLPPVEEGRRLADLTPALLAWYRARKRPLPWRSDADPYRVWVSEIMLQQTRIEAVLPYFDRFMQALPTVADLAACPEDRLLKLWEGLGYYSRVRHLQKAAQVLVADHNGNLPADAGALRRLPGIGDYTAGAIASIAFGLPEPAVDGNVLRVLSRLTASRADVLRPQVKTHFTAMVRLMLPHDAPGDFNQGLMELGERVCLPNADPLCEECPLRDGCRASKAGIAREIPTRAKSKPRRVERRTVLVCLCTGEKPRVLLQKRPEEGLLGGMWELPGLPGHLQPEQAAAAAGAWGLQAAEAEPLPAAKHAFSHIEWHMTGVCLTVSHAKPRADWQWVTGDQLDEAYALPSAFRTYAKWLKKRL